MSILNAITAGAGGVALTGDTSGNLTIQSAGTNVATFDTTGNLTLSTSNGGIVFNKSGALNNSSLNDYEVGTWSPSVGGNATYTNQYGFYVKVGRMVCATFDIQINTLGTGSTGTLSGFPFATLSSGIPHTGTISYWASLSTSLVAIGFYLQSNATTALFVGNNGTAGTTVGYNSFGLFGNGARIVGQVTYETNS